MGTIGVGHVAPLRARNLRGLDPALFHGVAGHHAPAGRLGLGQFLPAAVVRIGTARMEGAAPGRHQRRWQLAPEADALALALGIGHRRGGQ